MSAIKVSFTCINYLDIIDIKEKVKAIWMYVDKKQFSKESIDEIKKKYRLPSARDRINQYVTPVDFTTNMISQERGGELISSLNLSFGDE